MARQYNHQTILEPNALKSSFEGDRELEERLMGAYPLDTACIVRQHRKIWNLPPSGITEALGIHLAHIAHANDANRSIFLGASHSASDSCHGFRPALRGSHTRISDK